VFALSAVLAYLETALAIDKLAASSVSIDAVSGMSATDVQAAVAELKGTINALTTTVSTLTSLEHSDVVALGALISGLNAAAIPITAISGVTGSNVQAALAFIQGEVATNTTNIATNTSNISSNTSTISSHTTSITTLTSDVSSLNSAISSLSTLRVSARQYFMGTM
jgi:hypothetical protein